MLDYYIPKIGVAAAVHLDSATAELLSSLTKDDPNLQAGKPEPLDVGGRPARLVKLNTKISQGQDPDQQVYLYTVARESGLWYIAMAAQRSHAEELHEIFQQMIRSVQFPS
jgi:hypothetical protein